MVVSPLQVLREILDHPLTQLLLSTPLLAGVYLEFVEISIMTIGKGPHIYTSLYSHHGHELLEGGATCEFYHDFVDSYLSMWIIEVREA